jgi:hypothetical protein
MRPFLQGVRAQVRPGGTLLLMLFADGGAKGESEELTWMAGPVEIDGASASIAYASTSSTDRIDVRRTVTLVRSGVSEAHVDRYALYVWSPERMMAAFADAGWTYVAAYDESFSLLDPMRPFPRGEVLAVLRCPLHVGGCP